MTCEAHETAQIVRQAGGPLDLDLDHMSESFQQIKAFQALVRGNMVAGHDYGTIPGTKSQTLLKPGAEKIVKLMGLADSYLITDKNEDWDRPLFSYTVTCELRSIQTSNLISQGIGHANSMESRYRWRWTWASDVPDHVDKSTVVSREINTRRGRSKQYRLENDDVFSLVNTLLKMAKKRALVDAALSAGRLSEIFTSGHEDAVQGEQRGGGHAGPDSRTQALLEEIRAHLVRLWPGRSEADQQAKSGCLVELFGRSRWDEVEKLPLDVLQGGCEALQDRAAAGEGGEL